MLSAETVDLTLGETLADQLPLVVMPPIAVPALPETIRRVATIAGVQIDALSFDEVVETIVTHAECEGGMRYVVTPNAHHVMLLQKDSLFREIYERALLVVPDGVPLLWAGSLLGQGLRGRVNGTDLFESLCGKAAEKNLRVFLLGGREGAALAASVKLLSMFPNLEICGTYCPPLGFEDDPAEQAAIIQHVNAAAPHLLFVGLGAPKQEYWMHANREAINARVALGIGVSFEFVGGIVQRAPVWMRGAGLEWFHRLLTEPRRMWKRYLIGNVAFCMLVARQYFGGRTPS